MKVCCKAAWPNKSVWVKGSPSRQPALPNLPTVTGQFINKSLTLNVSAMLGRILLRNYRPWGEPRFPRSLSIAPSVHMLAQWCEKKKKSRKQLCEVKTFKAGASWLHFRFKRKGQFLGQARCKLVISPSLRIWDLHCLPNPILKERGKNGNSWE